LDAADHPRFQPLATTGPEVPGTDLLHEVAELRASFYVLAIGLGVAAILLGGLWFAYPRRGRLIAAAPRRQLPMIRAVERNQRQ
jgi:hypothetical protein